MPTGNATEAAVAMVVDAVQATGVGTVEATEDPGVSAVDEGG